VHVMPTALPLAPCVPITGVNRAPGKKHGNGNPKQERTLYAVACTRLFGPDVTSTTQVA
jgi:hypothetical protein